MKIEAREQAEARAQKYANRSSYTVYLYTYKNPIKKWFSPYRTTIHRQPNKNALAIFNPKKRSKSVARRAKEK